MDNDDAGNKKQIMIDKNALLTLPMVLENGIFDFDYACDFSGRMDDADPSDWSSGLRFGVASWPSKVISDVSCLTSL